MGKVDKLNKRLDWKVGVDRNNENQVVIKENWVRSLQEIIIEGSEIDMLEKIRKMRSRNKDVVRIVEEMKKAKVKKLQENEWQIERELMLKEKKVYVSKDEELRIEMIWLHHDVPAVGYGGRWKTVELVTRNYWWLEVTRDVGRYVEGYDLFQRIKNKSEELAGKLKLSKILEKP